MSWALAAVRLQKKKKKMKKSQKEEGRYISSQRSRKSSGTLVIDGVTQAFESIVSFLLLITEMWLIDASDGCWGTRICNTQHSGPSTCCTYVFMRAATHYYHGNLSDRAGRWTQQHLPGPSFLFKSKSEVM